jgi:hypothetical protein
MRKTCIGSAVLAVLAGAGVARAQFLQLDFGVSDGAGVGTTPNDVQDGFSSFAFNATASNASGDEVNSTGLTDSQSFGAVTVTVQVAEAGFNEPDPGGLPVHAEYRDRNGEVTTTAPDLGNLVEDFVFARNGPLTVTLSGVPAGPYSMTTYHHDPVFGGYTAGPITVNGTEVSGGGVPITNGFGAAGPVTPSSRTFDFTATGGDVVLVFAEGDNGSNPILNGFSLTAVPEPAAAALALLTAPLVMRRRRQSRPA